MTVIVCLSAMPTTVLAAWLGDVTRDDSVNMRDCMKLYQAISNGTQTDADFQQLGDITCDDALNMRDCMKLYQIISTGTALTEITLDSELPQNTLTPVPLEDYYGRTQLAAENANYVKAYDYIHEQVMAMSTTIKLQKYKLTLTEFERVLWHYREDHPEAFWLNRTYSYLYYSMGSNDYIYSMDQSYLFSEGEVSAYNVKLEEAANTFLEGITDAMPKPEREKLIHDRLVKNAAYDITYNADHTHDLIGVLINGTGVCESYARAFQYLLYRAGIRSSLVTGTANNGEYHMWNAVELDDGWYQVDVTWDDPVFSSPLPDYITYHYFNITTQQLLLDRNIETVYSNFDSSYRISYEMPACTQTKENYQLNNAVAISAFDPETVGHLVAESIKNDTVVMLRLTNGLTQSQFLSAFGDAVDFWIMIDYANDELPADQQLVSPGYVPKFNSTHQVFEIYLRNM